MVAVGYQEGNNTEMRRGRWKGKREILSDYNCDCERLALLYEASSFLIFFL